VRVYVVEPHWETRGGGSGAIDVLRHLSLRDRDEQIDFPIVEGAFTDQPGLGVAAVG
jgi:hypothetical protein